VTATFGDRVTAYAEAVVAGDVLAGEYVRLACARHLSDLDRADTDAFPFVFNPLMTDSAGIKYEPVERVCKFIELLPHVKGKWARQRKTLTLEDWQVFTVGSVFGWINRDTGLRRFRTAYDEVPRKNAKTTLASAIGLYMLTYDDEAGAEVYSAAGTADQAKISWSIAKTMVDKSPGMQARFGVRTYAHAITREMAGAFFHYLSSDSKGLDGLNTHAAIIDELHVHKNRAVFDVMETSTGSREQPLMFIITTAGSNRAGICYEQRGYTIKLLTGTIVDDTYFGIIYTIDKDDDWRDPSVWAKANPNYDVSIFPDDLKRLADKAMATPSAQSNFLTKRLNVWVNADDPWMNMGKWDGLADSSIDLKSFQGKLCRVGLDLSSKTDIAAFVAVFESVVSGVKHYAAFGRFYLPEETVYTTPNDQYKGWAESGYLTLTPGNIIDYAYIEDDLHGLSKNHQVAEVLYDPFQATYLSTRLMDEGFTMIEVGATVRNFSEPMKELEALVLSGRFHHDGNPVMSWMMSNVVCHYDQKDNIFPRKEKPENKIDGPVALIMAMNRFLTEEAPLQSVYERRGVLTL